MHACTSFSRCRMHDVCRCRYTRAHTHTLIHTMKHRSYLHRTISTGPTSIGPHSSTQSHIGPISNGNIPHLSLSLSLPLSLSLSPSLSRSLSLSFSLSLPRSPSPSPSLLLPPLPSVLFQGQGQSSLSATDCQAMVLASLMAVNVIEIVHMGSVINAILHDQAVLMNEQLKLCMLAHEEVSSPPP
jgi:hypothetical protein